jgi:hypothetical protein
VKTRLGKRLYYARYSTPFENFRIVKMRNHSRPFKRFTHCVSKASSRVVVP